MGASSPEVTVPNTAGGQVDEVYKIQNLVGKLIRDGRDHAKQLAKLSENQKRCLEQIAELRKQQQADKIEFRKLSKDSEMRVDGLNKAYDESWRKLEEYQTKFNLSIERAYAQMATDLEEVKALQEDLSITSFHDQWVIAEDI